MNKVSFLSDFMYLKMCQIFIRHVLNMDEWIQITVFTFSWKNVALIDKL